MINIERHLKSAGQIKLPGGVVGKTCTVLIVLILTIGGLAGISREPWIIACAIGLICIVVFTMLWRVISFAQANPQAAILEGAEFLAHTQITMASKSVPALPTTTPVEATPLSEELVSAVINDSEESDKEAIK